MALTQTIVRIIESCKEHYPCDADIRYNEPMAQHCTFKVGGPADCWIRPTGDGFPEFAGALLHMARSEHIPVCTLGGGANILVSDAGIRGIVLDTGGWTGLAAQEGSLLELRAGTSLDAAAEIAAALGLCGLEFLAGMPGSMGGALWMNARAYGSEIADVLYETEVVDFGNSQPERKRLPVKRDEYCYKHSPFQGRSQLIVSAACMLKQDDEQKIREKMEANRTDRTDKGHYRYPCAGSVFKNNPGFGKPSGQIIDELGLRGLQIGGAQIAPWHGNIIINTGDPAASAQDIRALVDEVSLKVKNATGFTLEPEILFF